MEIFEPGTCECPQIGEEVWKRAERKVETGEHPKDEEEMTAMSIFEDALRGPETV